MAGRSTPVLDIQEIVRRLRAGQPQRAIARDLGISRNTVSDYFVVANERGWIDGSLPEPEVIEAALRDRPSARGADQISSVEPFRQEVEAWLKEGTEGKAIHQLLVEKGFTGSYSAVRRYVRRLTSRNPDVFVRVERPPGKEAQVDFGYAGLIYDGECKRMRKAWVFVMVLAHSRHVYAELVWDQSVGTWLSLHARAFGFFGGVPEEVVLDNLKAGIVKACQTDPVVQRSYRNLASHYNFRIRPCRPRTPRHKGKVESGVRYVKRNALASRTFGSLREGNEHLRRWSLETAGQRTHGTIQKKPLEVFETVERQALQALPLEAYELTIWKRATLQPDCHVCFEKSFFSAPHRLVGKELWIRGTPGMVCIFDEWEWVASHLAAQEPGTRRTLEAHLPPEKLAYLQQTPEWCRQEAARIGPATEEVVTTLLEERPSDRLPGVQSILRLRKKYAAGRLEAACRRALRFDELRVTTIRRILETGLDVESLPDRAEEDVCGGDAGPRFARKWNEFFPDPGGESEEECRRPLN